MTAISIGHVQHLNSDEVDAEVGAWFNMGSRDGEVISDRAAATIAGWFAGPDADDMPFTVLAQQGRGNTAELGNAIMHLEDDELFRDSTLVLAALDVWVAQREEA